MDRIKQGWEWVKARLSVPAIVVIALAVLGLWFGLTAAFADLIARAQSGQLLAFFILIGKRETGVWLTYSLDPAFLLSGWVWALALMWGVPLYATGLRFGWKLRK
jgi:hypothetical protein